MIRVLVGIIRDGKHCQVYTCPYCRSHWFYVNDGWMLDKGDGCSYCRSWIENG